MAPPLKRALASTLLRAAGTFPAVVLTGPRQSGKTTLLKTLLSKTHARVDLENSDIRARAKEDPIAFLKQHPPPLIIDEIQYAPEILSYIKTRIDANRKPGQWILTGSQNFALMQGVTQSLAGRTAVLSLLPFSYSERLGAGDQTRGVSSWLKHPAARTAGKRLAMDSWLLRGGFPELACRPKIEKSLWCGSYITTYLERDVRNLTAVGDLNQFERFVRLCAARTAQILNLSEMAKELGISVPTAKRWLSVLEAGYQVYLLYPYYRNLGKRLVKSPKLYFTDTALACYLAGLHEAPALLGGSSLGAIFETMVIYDMVKRFLHSGQKPSMYYLRTLDGLEVDLVIDWGGKLHLFEIKSASTITEKHAASLKRLASDLGPRCGSTAVISNSDEDFLISGNIANYSWQSALAR